MSNLTQTKASRTRWTISVSSDFVVVGHDPEYAEMDNPQGAIVGERFHLEATNEYGDRRVAGSFVTPEEAEAAIAHAAPVAIWAESFPVYGSEAFVAYGEEELQAWEVRHQNWEDQFPGDRWARF
jgi:hypothetical protein